MADPEPIPLRALIVLISYELFTSDPRFFNQKLINSSVASQEFLTQARRDNEFLGREPKSIEKIELHKFEPEEERQIHEPLSTICKIHPKAGDEVKKLNLAQRERIFYTTRGHDGCFKAAGLFQLIFDLCPPSQQITIQIKDEKPVLMHVRLRKILEFKVKSPKFHGASLILSSPGLPIPQATDHYPTGSRDMEDHCVVAFLRPAARDDPYIVDLTRMQYGDAGRGTYGETYFLGTLHDFMTNTQEKICERLVYSGELDKIHPEAPEKEAKTGTMARLKGCAERVLKRWENRAIESWCEYCGEGGSSLKKCLGCTTASVHYCCKEHQKAGWKLHKYTCEKMQKRPLMVGGDIVED